jgi:D-sedoheptulose 7-phosphate isomerase
MLVAISSSGRSPNILAAVAVANRLALTVVTLSAMAPDNPLRASGSLNVYVPAETYGYAESCHAAILHHWMDTIEAQRIP